MANDGASRGRSTGGATRPAAIVQALLDGSDAQRRRALEVLLAGVAAADAAGDPPASRDPLLGLLRAQRNLLASGRERLLHALSEVADRLAPAIERRLARHGGADLRMVVELAHGLALPGLVPALTLLLDGPDRWTAVMALQAVGHVPGPEATAVLVEALARDDLRWTAVALLGDRGAVESMPQVARLLADPVVEVRLEALRALQAFGDRRLVPYLARCASGDPDVRVRERAAVAARHVASLHGVPLDEADLRPAVRLDLPEAPLDRLLAEARQRGASDVHLVPGAPPGFRIHGELADADGPPLSREEVEALILPAVPERLRDELQRELGVDFSHAVPGVGRHRVNVFLERRGWSAVIRVTPSEPPRLRDLGLPPAIREVVSLTQGLVLVTGRSGSGKSTTMAALVDLLNESRAVHVITLEDPIEYLHERKQALVNQREIGRHSESFPQALRAALREDPDVMVVGEMRDLVTMRMAVEAAETGHLVIATLHTPTAVGAVQRLVEAFPASEQQQVRLMLADALRMVVAQTLVRRKRGPGRVGAFELLVCTPAIAALVRENKLAQLSAQMQVSRAEGMRTLDAALLDLVQAGEISPEDAYAKAVNKEAFRGMIPGG